MQHLELSFHCTILVLTPGTTTPSIDSVPPRFESTGLPRTPPDVFSHATRQLTVADLRALNSSASLNGNASCFSTTADDDAAWRSYVVVQADHQLTARKLAPGTWADVEPVRHDACRAVNGAPRRAVP